jgi:hypothetical protein
MAILLFSPKLVVVAGVGAIALAVTTFAYLVWLERDVAGALEPSSESGM